MLTSQTPWCATLLSTLSILPVTQQIKKNQQPQTSVSINAIIPCRDTAGRMHGGAHRSLLASRQQRRPLLFRRLRDRSHLLDVQDQTLSQHQSGLSGRDATWHFPVASRDMRVTAQGHDTTTALGDVRTPSSRRCMQVRLRSLDTNPAHGEAVNRCRVSALAQKIQVCS